MSSTDIDEILKTLNNEELRTVKVAAVQAGPVFLNRDETIKKTVRLIEEAASNGAELIAFPEGFISSFPQWFEIHGECDLTRNLCKEMFKSAISIDSPYMEIITNTCRRCNINAVVGINEKMPGTTGTMYNTQVYILNNGTIAGKHQKFVPTTGERYVHTPGKTGYNNTFTTNFGTVSSLICGENSNPLAHYAASTFHPVMHVASWPALFNPFAEMHEIILRASAGLAYTLKAFVISSVNRVTDDFIDAVGTTDEIVTYLKEMQAKKRGAYIFNPIGRVICNGDGDDAELLYADLNLEDVLIPKVIQDFAGHYNRPEVFAPLFAEYLKS